MAAPGMLPRLASRIGRAFGRGRVGHEARLLRDSGLFDEAFYRTTYPEVATSGLDPLAHYLESGAAEGRMPNPFFDSRYYLDTNPDVAASGINPLVHFIEFGWRESRHPDVRFDLDWYRDAHLGGGSDTNPLVHYIVQGRQQGLEIRGVSNAGETLLRESGIFDADFYLANHPDVAAIAMDPLVHYLRYGAQEGRDPSPLFDTRYYLAHNRDVAASGANPLLHYCTVGWRELRNPARDFDTWWYWSTYLEPARDDTNPLAHYASIGRARGYEPRPRGPVAQLPGTGCRLEAGRRTRRVCLFAGYDPDGRVDDYVVAYLRELSRFADVYYLADCEMQAGELARLDGIVRGAWAYRHGEYDMGSYSRLARDHVGWDAIADYDELMFVNDSCYLLRSLDEVFQRMDGSACDWWGLQATKGIAATRRLARNRFRQPVPMATVRAMLLDEFEKDYQYDFLVGSYFLVFRRPVIADAGFRRLVGSVTAQASKKNVILKYEVGMTRYLVGHGFAFDTFVRYLYPFHPIFSDWYFRLLEEGFPLLKRYFLSENHYGVAQLHRWPERVGRKVPAADIDLIRRNLERVTDPGKLHERLNLGTARLVEDLPVPATLLDDEAFIAHDERAPKHPDWWGFPVCAFSGVFSGNERAVFEEVRADASIRKIVFTRGKPVPVEGENVHVVELESPEGQHALMRCGTVFIKHSPTRNLVHPVVSELRNIINLWHGIPFKRIGFASLDMQDRRAAIAEQHARCKAVISSSRIDTMAMASSFYPLAFDDVWMTGLPRNDFILRDEAALPDDLRQEASRLDAALAGRKLVLYMPTFRNAQEEGYYSFQPDQVAFLADWLRRNDAVLGIREHMADSARVYTRALAPLEPLDLSDECYPNVEVLYRRSAALVTDYSSCFIDYMLTGKPAISFAYDLEHYSALERGAFYELEDVFPGPVCRDFDGLRDALETLFEPRDVAARAVLDFKRKIFFEFVDDMSSARVVARAKELADLERFGQRKFLGDIK